MEDSVDKETIKALSADTRVEILKSLLRRRKMPAELSKQLSIAPSTVAGHLKLLECASLIARKETGHKWVYYELTKKGAKLVRPSFPVNIVLSFIAGLVFIGGAFLAQFQNFAQPVYSTLKTGIRDQAMETLPAAAPQAGNFAQQINWMPVALAVVGIALVILAIGLYWRRK